MLNGDVARVSLCMHARPTLNEISYRHSSFNATLRPHECDGGDVDINHRINIATTSRQQNIATSQHRNIATSQHHDIATSRQHRCSFILPPSPYSIRPSVHAPLGVNSVTAQQGCLLLCSDGRLQVSLRPPNHTTASNRPPARRSRHTLVLLNLRPPPSTSHFLLPF